MGEGEWDTLGGMGVADMVSRRVEWPRGENDKRKGELIWEVSLHPE